MGKGEIRTPGLDGLKQQIEETRTRTNRPAEITTWRKGEAGIRGVARSRETATFPFKRRKRKQTQRAGRSRPRTLRKSSRDGPASPLGGYEGERRNCSGFRNICTVVVGQQRLSMRFRSVRARSGINDPNRPMGSFIFLDPPGSERPNSIPGGISV